MSFTIKIVLFFSVFLLYSIKPLLAADSTATSPDTSNNAITDTTINPPARTSDLTVLQDIEDDKIKRTVNSAWTIKLSGYGVIGFYYGQRALKANTDKSLKPVNKQYEDGSYYFKTPAAGLFLKGKLREDPIKDGDLNYVVGFLLSGTSFSFSDLYLSWDLITTKRGNGLPYTVSATVGQFLIPFSSDNLAGEDKKPTINNAQYYTSWKLGRDIGLKFDQGFFNETDVATGIITPVINLSLALVNGSGANAVDSIRDKDFLAKVLFSPVQSFTNFFGQFSFGGSTLLKNINYVNDNLRFPIHRYTAEVNYLKQPFELTGEYVQGDTLVNNAVDKSVISKDNHNRVISKGLVLTAFFTWKPLTHIQPLFRYDYFDPNDANPGDYNKWYTLGANFFVYQTHPSVLHDYDVVASTRVVKLQANYTFKQEALGKKVKNNELGLQAYYSF